MTDRELCRILVEERGAIVRTQHHVQIPCGTRNGKSIYHNVWFGRHGLKWQLSGYKTTRESDAECLLEELGAFNPDATDLSWMQNLTATLARIETRTGVFVDAGWKKGTARAALIKKSSNGDMVIHVVNFDAATSHEAEMHAIYLAACTFGRIDPIHSDCESAVRQFGTPAVWIPRENNRAADRLGNRRGVK